MLTEKRRSLKPFGDAVVAGQEMLCLAYHSAGGVQRITRRQSEILLISVATANVSSVAT